MATELARSIFRYYDRFLHYSFAGFIGTIAHWILFYVLIRYNDIQVLFASAWGFLSGAIVNYLLNYYLTFQSEKKHFTATCKFGGIALLLFGFNMLLMYLFAIVTGIPALTSQIFSTAIILPIGYMLNKYFTF